MEETMNEEKKDAVASDNMGGGADQNDVNENKGISVLSYIGILVLIPLLAKKDSKYAQFHAKQGLVIFIGEIIVSFFNIIPILGQIIYVLGMLFFVVISIMGIVNALGGKMKKLPLVGDLGDKIMK